MTQDKGDSQAQEKVCNSLANGKPMILMKLNINKLITFVTDRQTNSTYTYLCSVLVLDTALLAQDILLGRTGWSAGDKQDRQDK